MQRFDDTNDTNGVYVVNGPVLGYFIGMSDETMTLRYPSDLRRQIDEWRVRQEPPLSRTKAIIHLLRLALEAARQKPPAARAPRASNP